MSALVFFLVSCSGDKQQDVSNKTADTAKVVSAAPYNYPQQLFRIDPVEFKLNKDDLPFPFDPEYLRMKKIRGIVMTAKITEDKFQSAEEFKWSIGTDGKVQAEEKTIEGKTANKIERRYTDGLLTELIIDNPGEKFETSISKVNYVYSNGKLITVYDILQNNDTLQTDYVYENDRLKMKTMKSREGVVSKTVIEYVDERPVKFEIYKGQGVKREEKTAIYNYTYAKSGRLLYADHWYPGISNDKYMFEFDRSGFLRDITYQIFLTKDNSQIPGKTKSYRYEYEGDLLKRINYFMQAPTSAQSGSFEFRYEFYNES